MTMHRPLRRARGWLILLLSLVAVVLLVEQGAFDGPWMWVILTLGAIVYGVCAGEWMVRSNMLRRVTHETPPVLPVLTGPDIPEGWMPVRCENCLRSGWVPPQTGKAVQAIGVHFLCTECADEARGEAS